MTTLPRNYDRYSIYDLKDHGKRDSNWIVEDEPWEPRWLDQEFGVNTNEIQTR